MEPAQGKKHKILITGSTGFVGDFLFHSDWKEKMEMVPVLRTNEFQYPQILPKAKYAIHLAGLAHQNQKDDLAYERSNVILTEEFLMTAIRNGVEHFVFFSTVKVLGEGQSQPYTELSIPHPQDAYANSKLRAEEMVKRLSIREGISYTILRVPLLYGPNPKANFRSLIQWIQKGRPVPISTKSNQRSILSLYNLKDFLERILEDSRSRNQTLLVQDPKPVSTYELGVAIGKCLGIKTKFIKIPEAFGKFSGLLLGQSKKWSRLAGSFSVDDRFTREILEWEPKFSTESGIQKMIQTSFKV